MSDPMSAAMLEGAKYAAQKGLEFIATKIYEGSPCKDADPEHQVITTKIYCMAIRGAAGADEKEFKQNLQNQLDRIAQTLAEVKRQVAVIDQNVNRLLREMDLLHLEIGEVVVGANAYKALQDIRVQYKGYLDTVLDLGSGTNRATNFFNEVIHDAKLHLKIDTVYDALVNSIAGKECLLRNIIKQIAVKGADKSLLHCYELYEAYVTSIVLDLLKGKLIFENAVQFLELLAAEKNNRS